MELGPWRPADFSGSDRRSWSPKPPREHFFRCPLADRGPGECLARSPARDRLALVRPPLAVPGTTPRTARSPAPGVGDAISGPRWQETWPRPSYWPLVAT